VHHDLFALDEDRMVPDYLTRPAKVLVAATVCLAVVVQLYILFSGMFTTFLANATWLLLYMAIGSAFSAAWLALIAWFGLAAPARKHRVRMIAGDCTLSLLFVAVWLLPALAIPIIIAIFAVSDWLVALIVIDALQRSWIRRRSPPAGQPGTG
jgi:hydrogenase-4 membrane subunit HyfE